jgi:type IX secretion system PorP/SprF family membrane protein
MRKAGILIFFAVSLLSSRLAHSQQLPLYSQYLYNKFLINPAHAGSDGYTSFNLTVREQWKGYSGAPRTYSLSGQMRLLKRGYKLRRILFTDHSLKYMPKTEGKIGLGGNIFNDRNGLVQRTGFGLTYSYHTWLEDYTQLSLGLGLTGYHFIIKADESSFENPDEPWLNDNLRRGVFVPDADFRVYILNPHYDIGLSTQQLFGSAAKIGEYAYRNFTMYRHYFLFGSYTFETSVKSEIEPSALFKMSGLLRPQADLGLTFIYDRSIWAGVDFRTGGAVIGHFRFKYVLSEVSQTTLYCGYAYDYTLNKIQKATLGTHEISVALKIGSTLKRFRWKDRF